MNKNAFDRAALLRVARQRFGIRDFRPGQCELIEAVLQGRDAIGVLPTGAGKSLTYQLPALLLSGPVVVVSPLIALMQDQQEKLAQLQIDAAKLNSTLSDLEERQVVQEIQRGEHPLIYVTPERLEQPECLELLKQKAVALLVVDEAHCVSQWGHDFRPAYLALRDAARELGRPPILALTATATDDVMSDMVEQLSMHDPLTVSMAVERENLQFAVLRTPSDDVKQHKLLELLRSASGTGILYAATIRVASELAEWLCGQGVNAGLYHGKLTKRKREETQHQFMNDEHTVMVATSAFGLGVDKPNIRFVIHYNFPQSLEAYLQEAGRAGRDGESARVTLLYRLEDKRIQSYFLGGKYPRRDESSRVVEALQAHARQHRDEKGAMVTAAELAKLADVPERRCRVIVAQLEHASIVSRRRGRVRMLRAISDAAELDKLLCEYEERHRDDHDRLESMMRYAQGANCRVTFIRDYFGDPSGVDCGQCDNCDAHARGQAAAGLAAEGAG
jgi:ATP-dependent DNA helicase RecQ